MGVMTISISDEAEKVLRKLSFEAKGKKKGSISETLEDLIKKEEDFKDQQRIRKRAIERLKKGYNMGKYKFNRDEIYDRWEYHRKRASGQ